LTKPNPLALTSYEKGTDDSQNLGSSFDGDLYISNTDSKTPGTTPNGEFTPSLMRWANTSDKLIYTENDLFVLDFSGTATVTQLTGNGTQVELGCEQAASWSPQDDQIAFDVQCVNQQVEGIYVGDLAVDSSSGKLTLVSFERILKRTTPSRMDWRRTWVSAP
jgi:hypothetical protein